MFSTVLLHDTKFVQHDTSFLCRVFWVGLKSRDTDRVCRFFALSLVAFTAASVAVV